MKYRNRSVSIAFAVVAVALVGFGLSACEFVEQSELIICGAVFVVGHVVWDIVKEVRK